MSTDTPLTTTADDGMLNPEQQEVVDHESGPLMVIAGAGTGKTRVLVRRISGLVSRGVQPWRLLAVTFTNKAAAEMRARLRRVLGPVAELMWIGTFHASCARILRRLGARVGLTRNFTIYDDVDQRKIVERILRDEGLAEVAAPGAVLARIDRAKNRGGDAGDLDLADHLGEVAQRVLPLYQGRLAAEDAVDFNDLLLKVLELFVAAPADAEVVASMFDHVLVDEFQDTNRVQFDLTARLAARTRNLTVVGDDDQAIYSWRGAEPRNLLDFGHDFPDARVVKLQQNYRSTQRILDAANGVISNNRDRYGKSLWSRVDGGHPPEVLVADDDREEARAVAHAIRAVVGTRVDGRWIAPADVAVLYRTNAQSRLVEEHLRWLRVPAVVVGSTSFFERREIRDVVAYLRLVANPAADAALERIVNVPPRGIGDKTLQRIAGVARAGRSSLLEAARCVAGDDAGATGVAAAQRRRVSEFVAVIDRLAEDARAGVSVSEIVVRVVEHSGMRQRLQDDASEDAADRLDHLAELVTMATDFVEDRVRSGEHATAFAVASESASRRGWAGTDASFDVAAIEASLAERPLGAPAVGDGAVGPVAGLVTTADSPAPELCAFLERISLSSERDDGDAAGVTLATVHAAKGLEWPIVFVVGMEDGLFPSLRDRAGSSAPVVDPVEEERRLAYVAITRAQLRLTLSHARTRRVWGEIRAQEPSRFLAEIAGACVSAVAVTSSPDLATTAARLSEVSEGAADVDLQVARDDGGTAVDGGDQLDLGL